MKTTIQTLAERGGYVPRALGYNECADLDGREARRFLETAGFVVVENGDRGRYGFARTECGITLSTNGYCKKDWAR